MKKPLVAVTMGDPAGVGPETIAGAWRDPVLHALCRPVVVGHPEVMRKAAALDNRRLAVEEVSSPEEAASDQNSLACLPCGPAGSAQVLPSTIDATAGQAAFDGIQLAVELAKAGRVDAITTAPINKCALNAAGYNYPGHTELLAELCGVDDVAMMLYLAGTGESSGLGVVHVTLHCALRDVFSQIRVENIVAKARAADAVMRGLMGNESSDQTPRIGVCALNPHAGEHGLFGDEEQQVIRPAVERGMADGLLVDGPFPADSLMRRAVEGEFDAVVAMYHDQGHIALKMVGMHRAVNATLGLPIIRTSVAHGTAFDLAWQGRAVTRGLLEAVRVATRLVECRTMLPWDANCCRVVTDRS